MNADTDDVVLDDDARELLAAMRESTALPPELHDRVWARIEDSVMPVAPPRVLPWRRIAVVGLAAAAAIVLVAGLARRDSAQGDATRGDAAEGREQAVYGRDAETAGGEVVRGDAGASTRSATSTTTPTTTPTPTTTTTTTPTTTTTTTTTPATAPPRPATLSRGRDEHPPSSLAQEIAAIEKIRAAILADAPSRALEHARAHARRFPEGALVQEREALRVVALCSLGEPGADAKAAAFVAAHPDSPLVSKVRSACADPAPEKSEGP